MKHAIIIDIDESRPDSLRVGHPPFIAKPTNPKQVAEILERDIEACINGLLSVSFMSINQLGTPKEYIQAKIEEALTRGFANPEFYFRPDRHGG